MTQLSAPVSKRPLSITDWRYILGDEPGIKEDNDGTAFALVLSTNSDEAIIGSTTQDSVTVVGGGHLTVPTGQPERVSIPAPTSGPRTDLIVARYDPEWAVLPTDEAQAAAHVGPCRLFLIPGSEGGGAPTHDATPPGVEDQVLYEVTRTPGTALSSNGTKVRDRRARTGPHLYVTDTLPAAPLGTVASFKGQIYTRTLDAQGAPIWSPSTTTNSGTSGVVAGTAPPAGQPLLTKRWNGSIATNDFGDATISYPGGAFPNGVVEVVVQVRTADPIIFNTWGETLDRTNVRGYDLKTGAPIGRLGVRATVTVTGW